MGSGVEYALMVDAITIAHPTAVDMGRETVLE